MTHRIIVVDAASQEKLGQKNAEVARTLFHTIQDSLLRSFAGRTEVSVQEVQANLNKFQERWSTIETFFTRAADETINSLSYVQQDRRKDHLTRLIFARILMKVPERPLPRATQPYPRALVGGLQGVIADMFAKPEWQLLNQNALWVFKFIGSDSDAAVIGHLRDNEAIQLFAERVFVTLLLRFYRFNVRRSEFIRIINDGLPEGVAKIGDPEFCEMFEALFDDFYALLRTELGRTRIEMSHGEEFLGRVRGIQDQYLRYKEGIAPKPQRRQA